MIDSLDKYIDSIKNLPPSPTLMVELLNLFKQPDRDIDQLVDLIKHDPSVTAEILRRCNSAFFGKEAPATDIYEAVFRLGFYEVYRLVSVLQGSRLIRVGAAEHGLDLESAWEHSALTAVAADALAREVQENEGAAFLAGLMHDIGKVVLACAGGVTYARVLKDAHSEISLIEAEKKYFGFNHSEIGGHLLARWGLPENITAPIRFHHRAQDAAEFTREAALIKIADSVAYLLAKGTSETIPSTGDDQFALQVLQLDQGKLASVMMRMRLDAERVSGLFAIRTQ